MANVRNLKKDINYVFGDIIEAVYIWELINPEKDTKASQQVIDDAINDFDVLIAKVNEKNVENKKAHFKSVSAELETRGKALINKINSL